MDTAVDINRNSIPIIVNGTLADSFLHSFNIFLGDRELCKIFLISGLSRPLVKIHLSYMTWPMGYYVITSAHEIYIRNNILTFYSNYHI